MTAPKHPRGDGSARGEGNAGGATRATALDRAYRRARYRLRLDGGPLELRLGRAQPAVAALLERHRARGAAWITACNPGSRCTDEARNQAAQRALEERLRRDGHTLYAGTALDPDGTWPAEPSVLVVGIGRAEAVALARSLDQNALLWVTAEGAAELVWTRRDESGGT